MIVAMEHAVIRRDRWTTAHELAALTAEVVDALRATYVNAHLPKGQATVEPLRVPRPGRRQKADAPTGAPLMRARDFLRALIGGER